MALLSYLRVNYWAIILQLQTQITVTCANHDVKYLTMTYYVIKHSMYSP